MLYISFIRLVHRLFSIIIALKISGGQGDAPHPTPSLSPSQIDLATMGEVFHINFVLPHVIPEIVLDLSDSIVT